MTSKVNISPQSLSNVCEKVSFRLSSSVCPLESAVYFQRLINFSGLFRSCLRTSDPKKKRRREGINQIWVSVKSRDKHK